MDLNLNDETYKQLVKMITKEKIEDVQDEIEAQIFLLAKKLKKTKVTRADDSSSSDDDSDDDFIGNGIKSNLLFSSHRKRTKLWQSFKIQ